MSNFVPIETNDPAPVEQSTKSTVYQQQLRSMLDREKSVRSDEQELKNLRAEVEESRRMQRLARENPTEWLSHVGIDYAAFAKQATETGDPNVALHRQMKTMQAQIDSYAQRDQQSQQEQSLSDARGLVIAELEALPGFDIVKKLDSQNAVADLVLQHHQQTGILMPTEEAAKRVEGQLTTQISKLRGLEAAQPFLTAEEVKQPISQVQSATLSNVDSATTPSTITPSTGRPTIEESAAKLTWINDD